MAGEYHEKDFDWDEHAMTAALIVARQEDAAIAHCSPSSPAVGPERAGTHADAHVSQATLATAVDAKRASSCAEMGGVASAQVGPQAEACSPMQSPFEGTKWEEFYRQNSTARFYKLRRYILLEFPMLAEPGALHVAEIGCGCGSSILPVMANNPLVRVTATVRI